MFVKNLIVAFLLIGISQCYPQLSETDLKIPPEASDKVKEAFEHGKDALKKKCEKNSKDPKAYDNIMAAVSTFDNCVKAIVTYETVKKEIEDAKPKGELDEVFKKYCDKSGELTGCFKTLTNKIEPCLESEEKANVKTMHNITERLAQFVCYNDGDRIALFIAEEGPDCFKNTTTEIGNCLKTTIGAGFDVNNIKNSISVDNLPKFDFSESHCTKIKSLQECVVEKLETCSTPTTANIVESLLKFIRRATPCKNVS